MQDIPTAPITPDAANADQPSNDGENIDNETADADTNADEAPAPVMGVWIRGETVSLRVTGFERGRFAGLVPPDGDADYARLDFEIENRGITILKLKPQRFRLRNQRGEEFVPAQTFAHDDLAQDPFILGLPPGHTTPMRLHYAVKRESPVIRLIFSDGTSLLPATIDENVSRPASTPRKRASKRRPRR